MAKQLHKFMDVDVIAFLEEKMKGNTKHYQSDFDIDKAAFQRYVQSPLKEDKTLLWLSRDSGTQLQKEYEAFIKDTEAYNTWTYFAGQKDSIVAYAVELIDIKDGTIRGNLYELDYGAHVAQVASKAVSFGESIKTFRDGFELTVPEGRGSYGYYLSFVADHGPIVSSLDLPKDKAEHDMVLAEQKATRSKMKELSPKKGRKIPLDQKIRSASALTGVPSQTKDFKKEATR